MAKISGLRQITPKPGDQVVIVAQQGDPEAGLANLVEVGGNSTHFAEVSRGNNEGAALLQTSTTAIEQGDVYATCTYTSAHPDSADEGNIASPTLMTADPTSDGIWVPPLTVGRVEFHQVYLPILTPPNTQVQPYVVSARLGGVVQEGSVTGSVNAYRQDINSQWYQGVTGSAVVINKTETAQLLTLSIQPSFGFEAGGFGVANGYLRAWYVKPWEGELVDFVAPTSDFAFNPETGRVPLEVTLTSGATGDVTSYVWDVEGQSTATSNGPSYTATITQEGETEITHTTIGPGGQSDPVTRTITLLPALVAPDIGSVTLAPTTDAVPADTVASVVVNGDANTLSIDWGDGTIETVPSVGGGETITEPHTYAAAGTYTVTATAVGEGGTSAEVTATFIATAAVAAPAVTNLSVSPTSGTGSVLVTVTATITGTATSATILWGDGNQTVVTSGLASIDEDHTYAQPGLYSVVVRATGEGGTSVSSATPITVNASAPTVSGFSATPTSGTLPVEVTATFTIDNPADSATIAWGDGETTDLTNVGGNGQTFTESHTYDAVGTPQISISGSGPGGALVAPTPIDLTIAGPVTVAGTIPFFIENSSTHAVTDQPLIASIPFALSDNVTDLSGMQVLDDAGNKVKTQVKVLSRYGLGKVYTDTDAPVRVIQVAFPGSIPAATYNPSNGETNYVPGVSNWQLKTDEATVTTGAMTFTDNTTHYTIAHGTTSFDIDKASMTGFRSATVDGASVISTPGTADVVMKSGAIAFSNVTTTIVEQGAYRVELLQIGDIQPMGRGTVKLSLRYIFHDGSNDVQMVPKIIQGEEYAWQGGDDLLAHLDEFYLSLPIVNSGSIDVVSANGTTNVPNADTYRLHQSVRQPLDLRSNGFDSRAWRPEGLPKAADSNRTQKHLCSHKEGIEGSELPYPETPYESSIQAVGSTASVSVAIEDFWKLSPAQYQVTGGRLRIGFFPDGIPGDEHFRGTPVRQTATTPRQIRIGTIDGTDPANWFPEGNNPLTGAPWAAGEIAPAGYPNIHPPIVGARPTSTGQAQGAVQSECWRYTIRAEYTDINSGRTGAVTVPTGQTFEAYKATFEAANVTRLLSATLEEWQFTGNTGYVNDDDVNYYRLQPGMDYAHRCTIRFRAGTTAATTTELLALQHKADKPVAGIALPSRWSSTDALGFKMAPTVTPKKDGNASAHPDVDYWERWPDMMADRFAADPQSNAGGLTTAIASGRYQTPISAIERGSSRPQSQVMRNLGKDEHGMIRWEGPKCSNNHYDQGGLALIQFFRRGDARILDYALPQCRHQIHRGTIHGDYDDAQKLGAFVGGSYYEDNIWLGVDGRAADSSHTWGKTLTLSWLAFGDEEARLAIHDRVAFWTHLTSGQAPYQNYVNARHPAAWSGGGGLRVPGWAIEGLTDIYNHYGDIPGREGVRVMDAALDGIKHIRAMESNTMGVGRTLVADGAMPANEVEAAYSTDGQSHLLPDRGYVLNRRGNGYNSFNQEQPWHHAIYFCAAAYHLMSRSDIDATTGDGVELYAHLKRFRDHQRGNLTYDPNGTLVTNFPDLWYPDESTIENNYTNYLPLSHMADLYAYAYFLFGGTTHEDAEDYTLAKHIAFASIRYFWKISQIPGPDLNKIPFGLEKLPGENYGDPTSANYDSNGLPLPDTEQAPNPIMIRHFHFSPGGDQPFKFWGEVLMRRFNATIAAMHAEGEVAEIS